MSVLTGISARVGHVSSLIAQKLELMVAAVDSGLIFSKRKAISALLPHAILLEQGGQRGMIDIIFHAARASRSSRSSLHTDFLWHRVALYTSRLFEGRSPTSLDRAITFISPYLPWHSTLNSPVAVTRWAAAALTIQYTEEVGQSVVDALLQIVHVGLLGSHVPVDIWRLLKRNPSLPPRYRGELWGVDASIIGYIRRLGDLEILKSFLLISWSDQYFPPGDIVYEMERVIREDFGGNAMKGLRNDLVERLDHLLAKDLGSDTARERYTKFRGVLLEMDSL